MSGIEFTPDFDYDAIMNRIETESEEHQYLLILDDILQFGDKLDLIFTRYEFLKFLNGKTKK